jgi:4,5-DOPA dioxygenase extradiol
MSRNERMPVIFFGHGNPMNAIQQNRWTETWRRIGEAMPRPKAIVCISAHWYLPATLVTGVEQPRTIHDFGTWSVLAHVFPKADIPLVQLSIDETKPAQFHYEIGRRLAPLRDEGILVMGSGNMIHNLHAYAWGGHPVEPFDWALRFEAQARALMLAGDYEPLVDYEALGRDAMLSAPTPDHYLPLLYILGAAHAGEPVTFPVEGIDGGSVSMLTVRIG